MKDKTCCFSGHRIISTAARARVATRLDETVRQLIAQGIEYFGVGGALGFDTLAAQTVLRLREEYPHIRLIMVLPCHTQAARWRAHDQAVYGEILRAADKVVYVSQEYTEECMRARNRRLVDESCMCVCYLTRYGGGTGYTVNYARQQGLQVINLAEV